MKRSADNLSPVRRIRMACFVEKAGTGIEKSGTGIGRGRTA